MVQLYYFEQFIIRSYTAFFGAKRISINRSLPSKVICLLYSGAQICNYGKLGVACLLRAVSYLVIINMHGLSYYWIYCCIRTLFFDNRRKESSLAKGTQAFEQLKNNYMYAAERARAQSCFGVASCSRSQNAARVRCTYVY